MWSIFGEGGPWTTLKNQVNLHVSPLFNYYFFSKLIFLKYFFLQVLLSPTISKSYRKILKNVVKILISKIQFSVMLFFSKHGLWSNYVSQLIWWLIWLLFRWSDISWVLLVCNFVLCVRICVFRRGPKKILFGENSKPQRPYGTEKFLFLWKCYAYIKRRVF